MGLVSLPAPKIPKKTKSALQKKKKKKKKTLGSSSSHPSFKSCQAHLTLKLKLKSPDPLTKGTQGQRRLNPIDAGPQWCISWTPPRLVAALDPPVRHPTQSGMSHGYPREGEGWIGFPGNILIGKLTKGPFWFQPQADCCLGHLDGKVKRKTKDGELRSPTTLPR